MNNEIALAQQNKKGNNTDESPLVVLETVTLLVTAINQAHSLYTHICNYFLKRPVQVQPIEGVTIQVQKNTIIRLTNHNGNYKCKVIINYNKDMDRKEAINETMACLDGYNLKWMLTSYLYKP